MKKAKLVVFPFALFLAGLFMFGARASAAADTCIWTGDGSDDNFTTAANWSTCDNGTVPEAGDTLEFPANITDRSPVNDMPANTSFAAINFTGAASSDSNYDISGADIDLVGGIAHTVSTVGSRIDTSIEFNIVLAGSQTFSSTNGGLVIEGTVSLGSNNLTIAGGGTVTFNGVISGSGNIVNNNSAYLDLFATNTFTGTVTSNDGVLTASVDGGLGATSAGTTLENDAVLSICGGGTSDATTAEPLTINGTTPSLTGYKLNISVACSGLGGGPDDATADPFTVLSGPITLTTDLTLSGYRRDMRITGALSGVGHSVTVATGTDFQVDISAASNDTDTANGVVKSALRSNTYSGNQSGLNPSLAFNNEAIVEAGATIGNVFIVGGTLKGAGTVGEISMDSGIIAPGLSPGCLASGNLTYSGGTEEIELGGTTACTEYDQQAVTGTVALGTATTLTISLYNSFVPAVGNTFTIISNDSNDAVTGTFSGLAEGATFTQDGVTYSITYVGGDGNDVVLTVTAVPAVPNTGIDKVTAPILAVTLMTVAATGLIIVARRFSKTKA